MFCSGLGQDFGSFPCCYPYAHPLGFLPRRVSGEQRGGAAEILSRIGVEHGERTQSTDPAAARTLDLLEM